MWNENVPTARILLETEEKTMERWCNLLQSAIQSEKETKRNETKKFMLHDLKLSNKKDTIIKLERLVTALRWLY
jgi:hypothetical protein